MADEEEPQKTQALPSWIKADSYGRPLAGARSLKIQRIAISQEERSWERQTRVLGKDNLSFAETMEPFQQGGATGGRTPGMWVHTTGVAVHSDSRAPSLFLAHVGKEGTATDCGASLPRSCSPRRGPSVRRPGSAPVRWLRPLRQQPAPGNWEPPPHPHRAPRADRAALLAAQDRVLRHGRRRRPLSTDDPVLLT
eukprot:TRINITY_DN50746_c0_g1_i1.p2 TRINITY_DN50746_c0_g1~~TRINITY_DN50746_c0_g1_i1.p2  ORF type:complete len:195 (+),score=44.66 TRINITY_DN50746_c0_g1_i1:118-702(+)